MNTIHWGRFAAVIGAAFVTGYAGGFSTALNAAQSTLGAGATAQDLLRAISASNVSGLLGAIALAVPAASAFFVQPHKPDVGEGTG